MTYGRVRLVNHKQALDGAAVSHSAELVRVSCSAFYDLGWRLDRKSVV